VSQSTERPVRDIVLIGGSSGAIEALRQILKPLPADFPGSIFVVVHTTPQRPGLLARVLDRSSGMSAVFPANGEPIRPGCIYVAPPDHHLVLGPDDTVLVYRGPRENGHRPAIDPLFRSAARYYAPRSIAVLLSGYLDDGSAGLHAVRSRGGLAIVQDPSDALAEEMPASALKYGSVDYVLPAREIGPKLLELVKQDGKVVAMKKRRGPARVSAVNESEMQMPNLLTAYPDEGNGTPSVFACPECHGVLWESKEGEAMRYRCRVGHAYSEATLNQELSQAAESALWAAMRALEEKASMARRMADAATGTHQWANRLREQAATYAAHADMLRKMIFGEPPVSEEVALSQASQGGQAD
jgi:two-component system chemotaxis response regulator CheB